MSDPDWPLADRDPRAFFGLGDDASLLDLKRAYARLIKTWKPDRFPVEFKRIRAAYEALECRFKETPPPLLPALDAPAPLMAAAKSAPPARDWLGQLHEQGLVITLAEMEAESRLEARDWLLLAALREAQNPARFCLTLIESLRHHPDDRELWQALLLELRRDWPTAELEPLARELATLHNHPEFLRRTHGFWAYCLESLPPDQVLPWLDRFLHRSHGPAHQEEARFVLGLLMRHGPALPLDWVSLQHAAYEQYWDPSLRHFAEDLAALPAIRVELQKSADPAARRLLDFFAAWGRQDLPELHRCRQELRQMLLHRTGKTPLLVVPELFLSASRLMGFRSRNLGGNRIFPKPQPPILLLNWCAARFSGTLDCLLQSLPITLGVLSVFVMLLASLFTSTQVSSHTLSSWIAGCWLILCPLLLMRFYSLVSGLSWSRSPRQILTCLALVCCSITPFGLCLLTVKRLKWLQTWGAEAKNEIFCVLWLLLILCMAWLTNVSPGPRVSADDCLSFYGLLLFLQYLCLLILCFKRFETVCLDHFARRWYRRRCRPYLGQLALLLSSCSMSLERLNVDLNLMKQTHPHLHHFAHAFLSDGDVHLAAAIWEAPRNRGED